jgi:hypothetical protein
MAVSKKYHTGENTQMIWFFAFSTAGMGIFIFFAALRKMKGISLARVIAGSVLMSVAAALSWKSQYC